MSEIIILIRWVTPQKKVENLQFEFFFSCSNSSNLQSLHSFCLCSSLSMYIFEFFCPLQHSLIANSSSCFLSKWMRSDSFPLYAKLNPVCSQILHVRSIWNPFKIFTMSLTAEEFVNETLKFPYLNFRLLPLKPFCIPL